MKKNVKGIEIKRLLQVIIRLSGVDGNYSYNLPFCYVCRYFGIQFYGSLKFDSHRKFLKGKLDLFVTPSLN